jgi:hypothetical protein
VDVPHQPNPRQPDPGRSGSGDADTDGDRLAAVTVRSGDDLINVVPFLLGLHPAEPSLVILVIDGPYPVVGAYVELTDLGDTHEQHSSGPSDPWHDVGLALPLAAAASAAAPAVPDPAVVVIGYLDRDRTDDLHRLADTSPAPVAGVFRVHAGRWWRLDCHDPGTCTDPGCTASGSRISNGDRVAAPFIVLGRTAAADREELRNRLRPDPERHGGAVAAKLPLNPRPTPDALFAAVSIARATRLDAEPGRTPPLQPDQAALLLQAIAVPGIRDTAALWLDDQTWALWLDLIRVAPPGWAAPLASLIALVAFQRGDGVIARVAVERALDDDPRYPLARLLDLALGAPITPQEIRDTLARAHHLRTTGSDPAASTAADSHHGEDDDQHHFEALDHKHGEDPR